MAKRKPLAYANGYIPTGGAIALLKESLAIQNDYSNMPDFSEGWSRQEKAGWIANRAKSDIQRYADALCTTLANAKRKIAAQHAAPSGLLPADTLLYDL